MFNSYFIQQAIDEYVKYNPKNSSDKRSFHNEEEDDIENYEYPLYEEV